MGNLKYVLVALVLIAVGYAAGEHYAPEKIKEVVVEKEVEKKNDNVSTHTVITEKPDGSKVTTTDTVDKSVTLVTDNKTDTTVVTNKKTDWHVALGEKYDYSVTGHYYTVSIERRVLGPIFLGVQGSTEKSVGVTIGLEF